MTNDDLSLVTLTIQNLKEGKIPIWLGRASQAFFLASVQNIAPFLAKKIHDGSSLRPYTASSVFGLTKTKGFNTKLKPLTKLSVNFSTLNAELTDIIADHLIHSWKNNRLNLCGQEFEVIEISCITTTFEELSTEFNNRSSSITLEFLSPTAFKKTSGVNIPLPLPELVFGSLLSRWNMFSHYQIPEQLRESFTRIYIDHISISSAKISLKSKHTVVGFYGKITFKYDKSLFMNRYIPILAKFAPFSCIGIKTTVGLGQVRERF